MSKGVRVRNGYYFLDFYYLNKRYRLYTTLTDEPKNKVKAEKLLDMLKIDLERGQFYLENYKFKLQNISSLEQLDHNFDNTKPRDIHINILIKEQLSLYEQMVAAGTLAFSTFRMYYYIINLHLLPYFKNKFVNDVDIPILENFISKLNFSRERIKKILRPLKEVLKKAQKSGLIKVNPIDELDNDIFKIHAVASSYKIFPFNQDEIDTILANCNSESIKNLIATGFYTGMRIGEMFALDWADIDFDSELIHINKSASVKGIIKDPKTKAGNRCIEMIPKAKSALLAQWQITGQDNSRVFKTPLGKNWINASHFGKFWKVTLTKGNVKYRNPYQMRHTFISMMLALGNSPMVLYPMVGHTNPQVIYQIYGKHIQHNGRKILKTE